MDAVMCLRLQLERQQAGLLPDLREYSKRFCLTTAHMELTKPGVTHHAPRPHPARARRFRRSGGQRPVADPRSGFRRVSVRMAVLYLLATRPDIKDNL